MSKLKTKNNIDCLLDSVVNSMNQINNESKVIQEADEI